MCVCIRALESADRHTHPLLLLLSGFRLVGDSDRPESIVYSSRKASKKRKERKKEDFSELLLVVAGQFPDCNHRRG